MLIYTTVTARTIHMGCLAGRGLTCEAYQLLLPVVHLTHAKIAFYAAPSCSSGGSAQGKSVADYKHALSIGIVISAMAPLTVSHWYTYWYTTYTLTSRDVMTAD